MINNIEFIRLKEIANTVKPIEVSLITHDTNGPQDSIVMKDKNLKVSVIEEFSQYNCTVLISDKRGLRVSIPCTGVEIYEENREVDILVYEFYFFTSEEFAQMTIKSKDDNIETIDKNVEYSKIIKKAKSCLNCEAMAGTEAVIGYQNGNLHADIMFIAEAPGPRGADVTGIPLHGDVTGNNFEKLLASTKWTRSDIFITNAVLCCSTNENGKVRSPFRAEVINCHSYLSSIIELVNPKVIVTLGKKALEALKEIESHQLILNKDVGSYTKWNNRWIYPLYHPSPQVINSGSRTLAQQTTDFKQLEYNFNNRIAKGIDPINYLYQNK